MPGKLSVPIGQRFGALVLVSEGEPLQSVGRLRTRWLMRCDCGAETLVIATGVRKGVVGRCGECAIIARTKHGCSNTSRRRSSVEYETWAKMKRRCQSPDDKDYPRYGGAGIALCDRWQSFENFLSDMGKRPSSGHSIDRINGILGYSPENCRWATLAEQAANKKSNRNVTLGGRTQHITAWAREYGVRKAVVFGRLHRGWTIERALGIQP